MGYVWQLPHSILIDIYNEEGYKTHQLGSDRTFKLAPSSRPVIQPAQLYKKELNSNWLNGSIDISNILTGPLKGNRTCEIEFYVLNELDDISAGPWNERYDNMLSLINGKICNLILQDDIIPGVGYSWTHGRVSVKSWKSEKDRSKVTLSFKVFPYKVKENAPPEDWPTGPDGNSWPPTPDFIPRWNETIWKYGSDDYVWKWNELFGVSIKFGYFEVRGGSEGTWKDIINTDANLINADILVDGGSVSATRYETFDYSRSGTHGQTITIPDQGSITGKLPLYPGDNYYYFNFSGSSEDKISILVMQNESTEVEA